jgi:iron complex outermembrane recepter protein
LKPIHPRIFNSPLSIGHVAVSIALIGWVTLAVESKAETQTSETLPAVTVKANADQGSDDGYVAKSALAGTKTDTEIIENPQSVTVVTEQQIAEQGSQTLQEIVRYSAGVTAEAYGLDNRGDWLFIRGTEHTEYRDGLRVQSQTFDMPRPNAYALERVEILRGPSSVLYGASTVGGQVNLVSKRPQAETRREMNLQYGSYDHKQVGIDLTGPMNETGSVLYRLVAMANDRGTQVDFTNMRKWFIAPSLTFIPSEDTSLMLLANFQRNDTDGATSAFPPHSGTILKNPNGKIPTRRFTGEPGYDHHDLAYNALGWEFKHDFNEIWSFRQNARASQSKLDYATLYPNVFGNPENPFLDADQRLVNRFGYANKQETDVFTIDNQMVSKWNIGQTHHTVLLGIDYLQVKQDNRNGFSFSPTPFDLYDPVYGNVPPSELAVAVDQPGQKVNQIGVYLQDQVRIGDHWTVTAGIRNDLVRNKVQFTDEQDDSAFTGRIGAVYLADNGLAPYISYSESFNPEIGLDINNQSFKPKRGKQTEVGVRYQPPGSASMYTVSIYDLKESNRIVYLPAGAVQKGEVNVWGLELDAIVSLTRKVDLLANYSYTHARTDDGDGGKGRLAEVHPHTASLWATYKFSLGDYDGFKMGGGVRYIGQNRDEAGVLKVPSTTLLDAMVAYEADEWLASLVANNLTDETYIASCLTRGDCWYGSRAKVIASFTYKF